MIVDLTKEQLNTLTEVFENALGCMHEYVTRDNQENAQIQLDEMKELARVLGIDPKLINEWSI